MVTWAYLAGFIDGDGWVTQSKRSFTIGVTQLATCEIFMKEIYNFLISNGVSCVMFQRDVNKMIRGEKSMSKMINIHIKEQNSLRIVCENILPYVLIKKEKVKACLHFALDRLDKRGVGNQLVLDGRKSKWNDAEVKLLLELQKSGYGNTAIAYRLNRSRDSISHKLYRLGMVRAPMF